MKKALLIILALLLIIGAAVIYVNRFVLPYQAKNLLIRSIADATKKQVSLEALEFSVFKGLVLRGLTLSDAGKGIFSVKEASCTFLIFPLFKRNIVIPDLRLRSPVLFLERRSDNTFNLKDLIPPEGLPGAKNKLNVLIYNLNISSGRIDFKDSACPGGFSKSLENLNLNVRFALPNRIKFALKSEIPASVRMKLAATGEYGLADKRLKIEGTLQDFSPAEFNGYYQNTGVVITAGSFDAAFALDLKDNIADIVLDTQGRNVNFSYAKTAVKLNAGIEAHLSYGLKDKKVDYSGKAKIMRAEILGLEKIDSIKDIQGDIKFDSRAVSGEKIKAEILGIPVEAKVSLAGFNPSQLKMNLAADFSLTAMQKIAKEHFALALPGSVSGQGRLSVDIAGVLPLAEPLEINGYLDLRGAAIKPDKFAYPIENISGRLDFTSAQLKWADLNLTVFAVPCKTSGLLSDFANPQVQLAVTSKDLSLESQVSLREKTLNISQCHLRYLGSDLSIIGSVNLAAAPKVSADISGKCSLDLKDAAYFLREHKEQWDRVRPEGLISAEFKLSGNPQDLKSLSIDAALSSGQLSLYGLKAQGFYLNYLQANGLADVSNMGFSLYDGQAQGSAKMNLNTPNLAWWLALNVQGVRLEKLKLDTELKGQDIAGIVNAETKLNGFSGDLNKLSGKGNIVINQGRLWQLNLFKGLGELLFARDFASIVFSEGSCDFILQDRAVATDNLKLLSNLAELTGSVRIGFDSSIDAAINVQVNDSTAPLTGTFRDVATAIIGQAGRFGVIRITGTLKTPKYRFQPAVVDILKSLKDSIFGKSR